MKNFYFFRPNLKNHFYLYYSWILAAKDAGIDVTMFTVMSRSQKNKQIQNYNEVIELPGVRIILTPHEVLNKYFTFVYLLFNVIKYGNVRLIAKKVNLSPLNFLKKLVGNRFRYTLELEGDAVSENEYLKKHPYKNGFYDDYLLASANNISTLDRKIKNADGLLVLSHAFKHELMCRYPRLDASKIKVTSTGFIKNRFSYNVNVREKYRKKLGLSGETAFIYAGNLYYSWQNMKKTVSFFSYYLKNVDDSSKFIILTHNSDQSIAKEFIDYYKVPLSSVILREVPNSEICNYYNASDISILLRSDDIMNKLASPGKIGEYAASGTPILTTPYIGDYATLFKDTELVRQIENIDDLFFMSQEVKKLLKATDEERKELSEWSNNKLSSDNNVNSFIEAFDI